MTSFGPFSFDLWSSIAPRGRTCLVSVARSVHLAGEELEADDGVDDHDEGHEQHDLGQGDHGQHDGVYDDLQACTLPQAGFPEILRYLGFA